MNARERMLIAMTNGTPDRVPVAPDISNMIPARRTGKPFWDIYLAQNPPLWRAYIEALRYFQFDGWFIYGALTFQTSGAAELVSRTVSERDGRKIEQLVYATPRGELDMENTYYDADPPTTTLKPIKNIARDFEAYKAFYPEITGYDRTEFDVMRAELGELGAFGCCIGYPGFQQWFGACQGGIEDLTLTYYTQPELIEAWRQLEERFLLRQMDMLLDARPDFILLGGSGSITLQSPDIFRQLSLPTIQKLTRLAKEAGVPTMLHSCGKERALVAMVAQETDLNCVNPLEVPPMGDCDLAEIKRAFGQRIALMGNLHTTDVMLKGTPAEVERAACKAIEDAGAGGGFILSTGDQCGRDTPDENIFKLIEVCHRVGRY